MNEKTFNIITDNLIKMAEIYVKTYDLKGKWLALYKLINDDGKNLFLEREKFKDFVNCFYEYLAYFGMARGKKGIRRPILRKILEGNQKVISSYITNPTYDNFLVVWEALFNSLNKSHNVSNSDVMISKIIMGLGGHHLATDFRVSWSLKNHPGLLYIGLDRLIEIVNMKSTDFRRKNGTTIPAARILDMALFVAKDYNGWLHYKYDENLLVRKTKRTRKKSS